MVFPQSLVYVTMFHALHQRGKSTQDQQMRMFALVFIVVFVYQVWPPPLVIAVHFILVAYALLPIYTLMFYLISETIRYSRRCYSQQLTP